MKEFYSHKTRNKAVRPPCTAKNTIKLTGFHEPYLSWREQLVPQCGNLMSKVNARRIVTNLRTKARYATTLLRKYRGVRL